MNRHDYFELLYLVSGKLVWQVQDRLLTQRRGELFLVGSMVYHRLFKFLYPPVKAIQLSFLPEVVRAACAPGDDAQYLMPFLQQGPTFQHVVSAAGGIPAKVVDLLGRIEVRLPATSDLDQLSVKTYLKMILVLLVENYANRDGPAKIFEHRRVLCSAFGPFSIC
jgi:hypothetical protein